ncbi:MAG: type II toxin-antitoxin system death-on-curing family toxin [Ktedonobacterales bacterium]
MADLQPIIYLTAGEVLAFNREILRRAGQSSALLRERGLLESAVQRPQNASYYTGADMVEQAALYMVGIAVNHPFVDGNKRTGYITGMTFLQINRHLDVDAGLNDAQMGVWLEQVVNRSIPLEAFVSRLRRRLTNP